MRNPDKFKGCLVGGAAGDALGYAVEFKNENAIFSAYGPDGITRYANGRGLISDDTQMSMFTAAGLLLGARSATSAAVLPDTRTISPSPMRTGTGPRPRNIR